MIVPTDAEWNRHVHGSDVDKEDSIEQRVTMRHNNKAGLSTLLHIMNPQQARRHCRL